MKDTLYEICAIFVCIVIGAIVVVMCESNRAGRENLTKSFPSASALQDKFEVPKVDMDPYGWKAKGVETPQPGKIDPRGKFVDPQKPTKIQQEADRLAEELRKQMQLNAEARDRLKWLLPGESIEVAPMPREKRDAVP